MDDDPPTRLIESMASPAHFEASPAHIEKGMPLMRASLFLTLVISIALIAGGIALVYLGSTGDTQVSLFGTDLKTQSVGAVGLICGVVIGVLGIRRSLLSLERLGRM